MDPQGAIMHSATVESLIADTTWYKKPNVHGEVSTPRRDVKKQIQGHEPLEHTSPKAWSQCQSLASIRAVRVHQDQPLTRLTKGHTRTQLQFSAVSLLRFYEKRYGRGHSMRHFSEPPRYQEVGRMAAPFAVGVDA